MPLLFLSVALAGKTVDLDIVFVQGDELQATTNVEMVQPDSATMALSLSTDIDVLEGGTLWHTPVKLRTTPRDLVAREHRPGEQPTTFTVSDPPAEDQGRLDNVRTSLSSLGEPVVVTLISPQRPTMDDGSTGPMRDLLGMSTMVLAMYPSGTHAVGDVWSTDLSGSTIRWTLDRANRRWAWLSGTATEASGMRVEIDVRLDRKHPGALEFAVDMVEEGGGLRIEREVRPR